MSWPPGWSLVEEGSPSRTRGLRLARAVYNAAVWPAGPEPMIRTSRGSATVGSSSVVGSALAGGALPSLLPEQQPNECEKSSEHEVRRPHPAREVAVEHAHQGDGEEHQGDGAHGGGHQAEHDQARHRD